MSDVCHLELIDSTDEVAFFFKIICNENMGKKNQKKFEFFQIMTVAEFEANDSSEIEYKLDPEYKSFRTKYAIGKKLLQYKKKAIFDAEILKLKYDQDGDCMFFTNVNIKPH